ncbi:hypothetical protein EMPG_09247, partial [Blastomyces silverae]
TMSLKKMSKILKSEMISNLSKQFIISIVKKTLVLEKLFQSLSQKKYNTLLHINNEKENIYEKEMKDEIDNEVENKDEE